MTSKNNQRGGQLVANPIPAEAEIPLAEISSVIEQALSAAQSAGIGGKAVTPFLLQHIFEATQGRSLEAQVEAAAGGRPEGLLGVVAEVVVAHQPATGRCKREGARTSRHPPVGQRRAWPRSTRRAGTWAAAAGSLCVQAVCGLCGVQG